MEFRRVLFRSRPKPAVGIFFTKQFNNYLGIRLSAHYAQLGYSDIYSKNEYQKNYTDLKRSSALTHKD